MGRESTFFFDRNTARAAADGDWRNAAQLYVLAAQQRGGDDRLTANAAYAAAKAR